jgi:hypothetical protein
MDSKEVALRDLAAPEEAGLPERGSAPWGPAYSINDHDTENTG